MITVTSDDADAVITSWYDNDSDIDVTFND